VSDGVTFSPKAQTIFRNCSNLRFRGALLFVAALTGCSTCFTFTSNPPIGVVGVMTNTPGPACNIPKVRSAVRLRLAAEPACPSCVGSGQIQHIFLGIQGIELNPNAAARDDSPDWLELFSEDFSAEPLQIDLMQGTADQGVPIPLGETAQFPAGTYRELRLRLFPNQPTADERLPEKSMCGSGTFNCVVMADGSVHPLQFNDGSPELLITPDNIEGASLSFPSDAPTELAIEWKLVWELSSSADTGVRLSPALAGSAKVTRVKLDESGTPEDEVVNDFRSR
jgi:Domain of unknown function (DUF4382)